MPANTPTSHTIKTQRPPRKCIVRPYLQNSYTKRESLTREEQKRSPRAAGLRPGSEDLLNNADHTLAQHKPYFFEEKTLVFFVLPLRENSRLCKRLEVPGQKKFIIVPFVVLRAPRGPLARSTRAQPTKDTIETHPQRK